MLNETDEISKSLMSSSQTGDFMISSLKLNTLKLKKNFKSSKEKTQTDVLILLKSITIGFG